MFPHCYARTIVNDHRMVELDDDREYDCHQFDAISFEIFVAADFVAPFLFACAGSFGDDPTGAVALYSTDTLSARIQAPRMICDLGFGVGADLAFFNQKVASKMHSALGNALQHFTLKHLTEFLLACGLATTERDVFENVKLRVQFNEKFLIGPMHSADSTDLFWIESVLAAWVSDKPHAFKKLEYHYRLGPSGMKTYHFEGTA